MIRHVLVAGALSCALLTMGAVSRPADALPISKLQAGSDSGSGVTLARRGGPGGFKSGGGGGFKGFKGGGGFKGFKGGGFKGFSGSSRRFGRHYGGIGKPHIGRRHHRHRPKIRIRPRYYGYAPYYYYDSYSYYDDRCAWLRRKAVRTGSRYWWRRYHRCVDAYY